MLGHVLNLPGRDLLVGLVVAGLILAVVALVQSRLGAVLAWAVALVGVALLILLVR